MKSIQLASLVLAGTLGLAACSDHTPTSNNPPDVGGQTPVQFSRGALFAPGQIIVRFKPGTSTQTGVSQLVAAQGLTLQRELLLSRTVVLNVERGKEQATAAALGRLASVEFAEPDYAVQVIPCGIGDCRAANDFFLGRKWDLHNDGFIHNTTLDSPPIAVTGKADADIDWLEMYDALGPDFAGSAKIGIIDSGIDGDHPDLAGKVVAARNFAPCDLSGPPDANGETSCALTPVPNRPGFFFVGEVDPTFTRDRQGHGTFVSGVAAAHGNNGIGVSGVGYNSNIKLLNAKVCEIYNFGTAEQPDVGGSCFASAQVNAIVWATDNGANVLNLSLGGNPTATAGPRAVQQAMQYARSNNVLPFCATGNNAVDSVYVGGISFPARFPECIAVGATDWGDNRASYSNFARDVELTAPGGDIDPSNPTALSLIASTNAGGGYVYGAGTSFATPQAAGLAAVLYATGLHDTDEIARRMEQTADDLGAPGRDDEYGFGRINACRALDPARVKVSMPPTIKTSNGGAPFFPVVIYGTGRFDLSRFNLADVTLGDGKGPDAHVLLAGDQYAAALRDVDQDGKLDLAVIFDRFDVLANYTGSASRAPLVVGGSVDCRRITGQQTVRFVPAKP